MNRREDFYLTSLKQFVFVSGARVSVATRDLEKLVMLLKRSRPPEMDKMRSQSSNIESRDFSPQRQSLGWRQKSSKVNAASFGFRITAIDPKQPATFMNLNKGLMVSRNSLNCYFPVRHKIFKILFLP